MGLKTEIRTIDGLEVRSAQLPALRTLALSAKLGRVAAPALGRLGGLSLRSSVADLIPAIMDLCSRLGEGEVESLATEILAATSVTVDDGKGPRLVTLNNRQAIDSVFSGRFRTMLYVIVFALEVNYSDFFAESPAPGTPAGGGKSAP